jgi:hypothetical protein
MSQESRPSEERDPEVGRRDVLRLLGGGFGLAAIAGCSTRSLTSRIPDPDYPGRTTTLASESVLPLEKTSVGPQGIKNVVARTSWTPSTPIYRSMDQMTPVRNITVHHDGMTKFTTGNILATKSRLETIRKAHRNRGWGDIGYHFAIDPSGRVWACRPLSWQGAHVKDFNEGNIGIVVLGNYDLQRPNNVQLSALKSHISTLRNAYRVSSRNVRSHRQCPGARTACPGRYLQPYISKVKGA